MIFENNLAVSRRNIDKNQRHLFIHFYSIPKKRDTRKKFVSYHNDQPSDVWARFMPLLGITLECSFEWIEGDDSDSTMG